MPHGGGEHVRPDFITERRWGKRFPITAVKPALPTQTPHTRPLTAAGHSEAWDVCCRRGWGGVGRMSGAGSAHTSTAAVQAVSTQRAGKPGMRSIQGTECCFHPTRVALSGTLLWAHPWGLGAGSNRSVYFYFLKIFGTSKAMSKWNRVVLISNYNANSAL